MQANFEYDEYAALLTHSAPLVVQVDIIALRSLSVVNVSGSNKLPTKNPIHILLLNLQLVECY